MPRKKTSNFISALAKRSRMSTKKAQQRTFDVIGKAMRRVRKVTRKLTETLSGSKKRLRKK